MFKALIIGCGKIAGGIGAICLNTHAGVYQSNPDIELVACFDIDKDKLLSFAARYACQAEHNLYDALKKHRPDVISICTPDSSHFSITQKILASEFAPRVIFLEKPVCTTIEELTELQKLARFHHVDVVINHTRRFDICHQEIKAKIFANEFGKLHQADIIYYGGWQHNGVHVVDTLSFLFDDQLRVDKVTGLVDSRFILDPTLELELRFVNKVGRIRVSGVDESLYQLFEFDLRFENARLRIEDFGNRVVLEKQKINNIGESVLVSVENKLVNRDVSPMQTAISLICSRLKMDDSSLLKGYCLEDTAFTMKTIWEGLDAYTNQFETT